MADEPGTSPPNDEIWQSLQIPRLYHALMLMGEDIGDHGRLLIADPSKLTDVFPTATERRNVLQYLEAKVLTPELLEAHREYKKLVFPFIISEMLDSDKKSRSDESRIELFTYPAAFAANAATPFWQKILFETTKEKLAREAENLENTKRNLMRWVDIIGDPHRNDDGEISR